MAIIYDRKNNTSFEGSGPQSGTYGSMSMRRLCETLESCGEVQHPERITHLEIRGDIVKYRVERAPEQSGSKEG